MKTRLNPWPATTDLFSGLVAATFGALMLYIPYSVQENEKLGKQLATEARMNKLQQRATELRDRVKSALEGIKGTKAPRKCGEDLCLDVDIRFALNKSDIHPVYEQNLREVARRVKEALSGIPAAQRRCVELTIEGHTDRRVPRFTMAERDRFLYNWRLSSERAASVLHLFAGEGVNSSEYRILALGYADSEPLRKCVESDETCNGDNRRTTFRIRIDTANLEKHGGSRPLENK